MPSVPDAMARQPWHSALRREISSHAQAHARAWTRGPSTDPVQVFLPCAWVLNHARKLREQLSQKNISEKGNDILNAYRPFLMFFTLNPDILR
jgi:hypothetical protein